ncbi:MAG: class I tRNA ligase family protein [Clostridia bacterium]
MKIVSGKDYTKTINLPGSSIPVAGDLVKREKYFLEKIQDITKYKDVVARNKKNGGKKYKIAEVPINIVDKLDETSRVNKIYKDIFIRHEIMTGNLVEHEILFTSSKESQDSSDIESESELEEDDTKKKEVKEKLKKKQSKSTSQLAKLRQSNSQRLEESVKKQIIQINDLGTILNYNVSNMTEFKTEFRDKMLDAFLALYKEDKLHKVLKPVHWCTTCGKSISNKNMKYEKTKVDCSYILYKVDSDEGVLSKYGELSNTYFIATTLRPWQMLSSQYIALAKNTEYSIVEVKEKEITYHYIMASKVIDQVMQLGFFVNYEEIDSFKSKDLKKLICINPIDASKRIKIIDTKKDYVILNQRQGTGVSVISAANNYLDYMILVDAGLEENVRNVIDKKGNITTINLNYVKKSYKDVSDMIISNLKEVKTLYAQELVNIKMPKCRTCQSEAVYRIISQWYLKKKDEIISEQQMEKIREKISSGNIYKTKEFSETINRVNNIKEEIVSDERIVGTPIPTFYCANCGKEIINDISINAIKELLKDKGVEQWHKLTPEEILKGLVSCECGCGFFFKDESTLNEFFGVVSTVLVHDVEDESTENISIESQDSFAKKLLAISFSSNIEKELDRITRLMVHPSMQELKSTKSNQYILDEAIKKYGTDVLRLWAVANSDKNVLCLNEQSIINTKHSYTAIRRAFKYMLSNLSDYNPIKNRVLLVDRNDLDKIMYKKLKELVETLNKYYEELDFSKLYKEIIKFCKEDLAKYYFETNKFNLYILNKEDKQRRSVQSTMYGIVMALVVYVEPILPFTLEEIWPNIWHKSMGEAENLLMYKFKMASIDNDFAEEEAKWKTIYYIADKVKTHIYIAQKNKIINSTLEASVIINTKEKQKDFIEKNYEDLLHALNVSKIEANIADKGSISVKKALGTTCARCNNYSQEIGIDLKYRYLCPSCAKILHRLD